MCVFSSFAAELVEALAAEEFFSASINLFIITKNVPSVILYGHVCEKDKVVAKEQYWDEKEQKRNCVGS